MKQTKLRGIINFHHSEADIRMIAHRIYRRLRCLKLEGLSIEMIEANGEWQVFTPITKAKRKKKN